MLQIIFGDDEHTAADGSYARVMKTRKWLYFSSSASLAISFGLYNEKAASELVKFVSLPVDVVSPAFAIGTLYLLIQYISLIGQLYSTYDIVLSERFTFRRADELSLARDKVGDAHRVLLEKTAEFRNDNKLAYEERVRQLETGLHDSGIILKEAERLRLAAEDAGAPADQVAALRHRESRQKAERATLSRSIRRLKNDRVAELAPSFDPNVRLAESALFEANSALYKLERQVPSERQGYQFAERLIDLIRVAPPILIAVAAIFHYFKWWPFNA